MITRNILKPLNDWSSSSIMRKEVTQEMLRERFDYHKDGYFIHKRSTPKRHKAGSLLITKTCHKGGRKDLKIFGRYQSYSRMIFLWHHGYLPEVVDHINRDPSDDRIENLRASNRVLNRANASFSKRNKNKYKGVVYQHRGYVAQLRSNNTCFYLGRYKTAEEAALAYNKKALELFGTHAYLNTIQSEST